MVQDGFRSALVVDDHPLFCDALVMTLQSACGITRVETADRLSSALERLDKTGVPDVVVLDLHLPDVDGLDGLIRIKKSAGDTPVVIVSSMADERMVMSARKVGAAGFVPKHSRREVLREAFGAIAAGDTFFPELDTEAVDPAATDRKREDALSRLATLTRQQSRILDLICEGKLNKQIAYDLTIAETTVKAHVTAIMRKLGVQSRTQAVLIAREASFASVLQPPSEPA